MKLLLLFSEGPHDVAFIKLVLELGLDIRHIEHVRINDFPNPLSKIFMQILKEHFVDDVALEMVHRFSLPNYVFRKDDSYIMLFNTGGKDKFFVIKQLVSKIYLKLNEQDASFDFTPSDIIYLFTYDSDFKTAENEDKEIRNNLFPITENDAYPEDKEFFSENPKVFLAGNEENLNFFFWPNNEDKGTLEDILLPIYKSNNQILLQNTENFVDDNFSDIFCIADKNEQEKVSITAAKHKAEITMAGQGKKNKAGKPMSAIVMDNVLSDKQAFINDRNVKRFVTFLNNLI